MADYILGYVTGYEDAQRGDRAQANPDRAAYNTGYDYGHRAGTKRERPDYTRDDLAQIRKREADYLSFFAN